VATLRKNSFFELGGVGPVSEVVVFQLYFLFNDFVITSVFHIPSS